MIMKPLHELTIKNFHEGLLNKEFSALEVTQAHFARIKERDKDIKAYLSLAEESAIREAEAVDVAVAQDENVGMLAGVPMAIKDNILIKGLPATAASKILEHYVASYDAGVIQKLKKERAVFLGKTNLDEFAMGSSTENSAYQVTHNPHDLTRVPGGSSGGSAAAVTDHMALGALGSDTGGSVRQPASFCGIAAMSPTYGAVSRSGVIAMASSLDEVGPIAKTVEDVAILFKAIIGKDPLDATSVAYDYGDDILAPSFEKIKSMKIGLPEEYFTAGTDPSVTKAMETAIATLTSMGLSFKKVSLPHTKYALSTYYIVVPAEVSWILARYDGIRYGANEGQRVEEEALRISISKPAENFSVQKRNDASFWEPTSSRPAITTPTMTRHSACARSSRATSPKRSKMLTFCSRRSLRHPPSKSGRKSMTRWPCIWLTSFQSPQARGTAGARRARQRRFSPADRLPAHRRTLARGGHTGNRTIL